MLTKTHVDNSTFVSCFGALLLMAREGEVRQDRADDADYHVRRNAAAVHVEAASHHEQPGHHQGVRRKLPSNRRQVTEAVDDIV